MTLPNFLIIGVQKAGTTSIYNYLLEHPQIYMSPIKETNFLEQEWDKLNIDTTKNKQTQKPKTFADYVKLFDAVQDEVAIGEASPNYLMHYQTSSQLIKRYVPDAKLIIILRNPVERAYSDHLMHIRDAINSKPRSLSEQIEHSANTSHVLIKGLYYRQIKHFYEHFERDKIQIYFYEDLCQDAVKMMQDIYGFLGVDNTFVPTTSKKAQTAQIPKNKLINKILRRKNLLRQIVASTLRLFMPTEARQKLRDRLINANSTGKEAIKLSSPERQKLFDYYREDILNLQQLIGKDLSHWLG